MALNLKKPATPKATDKPTTNSDVARFIKEATKSPKSGSTPASNFRLGAAGNEILDTDAAITGQSRTTILKAALLAWSELDEAQKIQFIVNSAKM